jgi:predicted nucleic acid-binding protein
MTAIVIDASVVAALYVEEPFSVAARETLARSREEGADLHAPDLLLIECANALWKRVRRDELDREAAMAAIGELSRLEDLELHPMDERLAPPALSLAIAHELTAYDAAYAALAVQLGGVVVSGDRRFVERATGCGLPVISAAAASLPK